jgi:hypothetical protein
MLAPWIRYGCRGVSPKQGEGKRGDPGFASAMGSQIFQKADDPAPKLLRLPLRLGPALV